jgi:succinate dehydrogenase (ubiquinone) cytochrome b560 subunit
MPGSFPYYFGVLSSCAFGPALIISTKFLLAWPFVYHFANGLRHLFWDLGKGFEIKQLYASGWAVVGISTLLSLGLALM